MAEQPNPPGNTPPPIKIKSAEKKSDTTRIDLASAKPPPSIIDKGNLPPDADDVFKRSTMRIEVPPATGAAPGGKNSDTTRIDVPPAATDAGAVKAALPPDDAFKTKTAPVAVPAVPPAAPTAPGRPKTIQFKRPTAAPGESIMVSPENTASATAQARKSETARIDLSAEELERPSTRPKTIRIKRPDGTSARKALTISRPEESAAPAEAAPSAEELASPDAQPGILETLAAIAALLVVGVLFYVLLAQTLLPDLSFPGRI